MDACQHPHPAVTHATPYHRGTRFVQYHCPDCGAELDEVEED